MKRVPLLIFLVAITFVSLTACETIPTNDPEPEPVYYDQADQENLIDFEVVLHEHANFRGRQVRYALEPGQRHMLVDFVGWGVNDRVSSIECGYRVGVALFRDRDFKGPVAIYDRSSDMVDRDINDWASSAIIFDLDSGGPLGIWLGNGGGGQPNVFDVNGFHGEAQFFPMDEDINSMETEYRGVGAFNDNAEWVILGPADRREYRRSNYRDRRAVPRNDRQRYGDNRRYNRGGGVGIEAYVYEHDRFRGRSIALPERGRRGTFFDLQRMNFSRIISSIAIREVQGWRR